MCSTAQGTSWMMGAAGLLHVKCALAWQLRSFALSYSSWHATTIAQTYNSTIRFPGAPSDPLSSCITPGSADGPCPACWIRGLMHSIFSVNEASYTFGILSECAALWVGRVLDQGLFELAMFDR
eukprot:scaffold39081_cov25-Tisochrysis_lutea.AAC.1